MSNQNLDDACYSKAWVKRRGWSEAMVRDLLGEPDITEEKVFCRMENGQHSHRVWRRDTFYSRLRVEAVEKTLAFRNRLKEKNERVKTRAAGGAN